MMLDTAAEVPDQNRATPSCPHFGPCGGCQLQHLTYPAQLALKAARLNALLTGTNLPLPQLQLHASPSLAYRNRIRLTLAEIDGQLHAGYLTANPQQPLTTNLQSSSTGNQPTFLPITQCSIAAPILWRTTEALLTILNDNPAAWLRNPQFKLDQLEPFTTADESALQFTLYLRTAAKSLPNQLTATFTALCETLQTEVPQLTGASIAVLPIASHTRSRRNESPRPGPTWGVPGLLYPVPQPTTQPATDNQQPATSWVPRGAFFQINRFLIPKLLSLVTSNRIGHLAFDLYAGVGLISRALTHTFTRVTAVEAAEPAASALAATKLRNLHAVKATTLDFLRIAVVDRDRPDLIILDPPRTGAGPEVCTLLARIAAPTLIYVSCSPEILPADLTTLAASGYTITELHLLDLFPQTNHIETIAILTRWPTIAAKPHADVIES